MCKHLINFNDPEERLVLRAIFSTPPLNTPKGFLDVFTTSEVQMMISSDTVWNSWSRSTRDWIISAFDEILHNEMTLDNHTK